MASSDVVFQLPTADDATLTSLVRVLFGLSEERHDARVMVVDGPHVLVGALSTPRLAHVAVRAVIDRAGAGHSDLPISYGDVGELFGALLAVNFGEATSSRIGALHAGNVRRLLYLLVTGVVGHFSAVHSAGTPLASWRAQMECSLRIAIGIVGGLRALLPAAVRTAGWTAVHVLAMLLETTPGTALRGGHQLTESLAFFVLCDVVAERAIDECGERSSSAALVDLSSTLGWLACSTMWRPFVEKAAASCPTQLKSCVAFVRLLDEFATPTPRRPLSPIRQKRRATYTSPSSEVGKKVARSRSHDPIKLEF
jgi:hypothetical protein